MEFIYKLILREDLFEEQNWTEKEELIVSKHFNYLQTLLQKDILILAGKTDGLDETTYGIVLFKANSREEATTIMNNDPAIINHVMTGTLHQYNIALYNNEYKK
jgi:uncharacterized protein YciI